MTAFSGSKVWIHKQTTNYFSYFSDFLTNIRKANNRRKNRTYTFVCKRGL